jgi:hypothetical protein
MSYDLGFSGKKQSAATAGKLERILVEAPIFFVFHNSTYLFIQNERKQSVALCCQAWAQDLPFY